MKKLFDEADDFNRDFQAFLTEYCWGHAWGRDGLIRRQRSILNLGMLAALNRGPEFDLHFRAALKNGLTVKELKDALLQIAIYCGIPTGAEVHRIATKVLAELKEEGGAPSIPTEA